MLYKVFILILNKFIEYKQKPNISYRKSIILFKKSKKNFTLNNRTLSCSFTDIFAANRVITFLLVIGVLKFCLINFRLKLGSETLPCKTPHLINLKRLKKEIVLESWYGNVYNKKVDMVMLKCKLFTLHWLKRFY